MQKDLRTAWLLLLLRRGPSYGYGLCRELKCRALEIDPAEMYRSLRSLESDGVISSHWMASATGPRRRVYDLTDAGRDALTQMVQQVAVSREAHCAFLAAYEEPVTPLREDD